MPGADAHREETIDTRSTNRRRERNDGTRAQNVDAVAIIPFVDERGGGEGRCGGRLGGTVGEEKKRRAEMKTEKARFSYIRTVRGFGDN